jgi:diaminohydroxyphosphoribosylaminopyrimidine deaminase / 5-amino-6-(5-phosphoribosylamino)uracil reductase
LRLNKELNIFSNLVKTLIFNELENKIDGNNEFIKIDFQINILPEIIENLYNKNIQSLLVEGGTNLLQSFLDIDLFDEIRLFRSPNNIGKGIIAPILPRSLTLVNKENLLGDELSIYTK